MVITASVIITCFLLIVINFYSVIRDKRQADKVRKDCFKRISGLEYDIRLMRDELIDVVIKYNILASDPAKQIDIMAIDKRFRTVEMQLHDLNKRKDEIS